MPKQAVVYVLDGSSSMGRHAFGSTTTTRFECAKQGVLQMMGDLMMQSKTNECSVIVLQTQDTCHHLYQPDNSDDDKNNNNGRDKMQEDEDDDDNETEEPNDIPFPHLTEYCPAGVRRPTVALLRAIQELQPREEEEEADDSSSPFIGGDFTDGILLAADALHQRTKNLAFERSIVLWTDARGYNVVMDVPQMLQVIDSLRSMDCRLYVVGMDFRTPSVEYRLPAVAPTSLSPSKQNDNDDVANHDPEDEEGVASKKQKKEAPTPESDQDTDGDDTGNEEQEDDDDDNDDTTKNPDELVYETPEDRERLLRSLTEKTGGTVLAAHTMQEILQQQKGQRLPSVGVAYKVECRLTPTLVLHDVRYSLWASPMAVKSFQLEAVQVVEDQDDANDENDENDAKPPRGDDNKDSQEGTPTTVRKNALGEEMTEEVTKITAFVDPEDPHTVIPLTETTKALRYGADLIPMNDFDIQGLKAADSSIPRFAKPTIQVLGYMLESQVPRVYRQGPPYRIFSVDGRFSRNTVALSSLARALTRSNKVAIVLFNKKRDGEPVLGGLFPTNNTEVDPSPNSHPLVFLQLPYAGDIKELPTHAFDPAPPSPPKESDRDDSSDQQLQIAKDLIRGLSLSNDSRCPVLPQNPFIKAWNQTLLARALDPQAEPVCQRDADAGWNELQTPPNLLEQARTRMQTFRSTFPIQPRLDKASEKAKRYGNRKVLTYRDFLKESS